MRKVVKTAGIILIAVGLIITGYVLWEVLFSDISGKQEREQMVKEFEQNPNYVTPADNPNPKKQYGDPPVREWNYNYLDTLGILHVPSWDNMKMPIREGSTRKALRGAAGHYEDTQYMGEIGNFGISAHRRSHGSNFRHIDELRQGDHVIVETDDIFYVYKVFSNEIVLPENVDVLLPVPHKPDEKPEKRLMTLTTCHPEWGETERFVVYTELEYWMWKKDGKPSEKR